MVLYVPGARGAGWATGHNDFGIQPVFSAPSALAAINSGTLGSYGSVVNPLGGYTIDVDMGHLILEWTIPNRTNQDNRTEAEILIDRAGGASWDTTNPLISGITLGGTATSNTTQQKLELPLFVPAGSSLGIRSKSVNSVARQYKMGLTLIAKHALPPGYRVGQKGVAIGANAYPDLGGTEVPGNSAWTNVGSTLESDTFGLTLLYGGPSSNAIGGAYASIAQIGTSSTPLWHPQIHGFVSTSEVFSPGHRSINAGTVIPAGTQLQVRHASTGSETYRFMIVGVV